MLKTQICVTRPQCANFRGTRGPTVRPDRRREIVQSDVWSVMQLVQVAGWLRGSWCKVFRSGPCIDTGHSNHFGGAVQNETNQTIAADEPRTSLRCSFQSIFPVFLYFYCLLFIVYCLLFIVYCLLFIVYCLLFIVCCLLFIVYCNRLLFSILRNFLHLFILSFFSFLKSLLY